MKKVLLVKNSEVKVKPFMLDDFIQGKESSTKRNKITKKSLKYLAEELGLGYDEAQIIFTKKMITAYLERLG